VRELPSEQMEYIYIYIVFITLFDVCKYYFLYKERCILEYYIDDICTYVIIYVKNSCILYY